MTTETQTLNSLVPLASLFSSGFAAGVVAAHPFDLASKKPSYGYDDEDEDDGYDDEEGEEDDEEDEDEEEDEDYDDEEEDYDDEDEDDDEEDEDDEDDEDEDEDIGYYTRPLELLCS